MNVKIFFALAFLCPSLWCEGLPVYTGGNPSPSNYNSKPVQAPAPKAPEMPTLQRQLNDLKYELNNQGSEIHTLEEQIRNQETILDNLRQDLTQNIQDQKDFNRGQTVDLESKLETLDNTVKGIISDLRQMKNQANDSVAVLGQYKQKLSDLEKIIEAQNQHMHNLETALASIMEVLQAKDVSDKAMTRLNDGPKTYRVQSGDTLEKIARSNKVSIQTLRDLNKLNNDRIMVGQTLKIP